MDVSVRYIPTSQYRGQWVGNKPALCFRGTDYAHCVIYDETIIHPVRIPVREHDRSPTVAYGSAAYPVARYLDALRSAVSQGKPISRGTIRLIQRAGLPLDGLPSLTGDDTDDPTAANPSHRTPPVREGADTVKALAAELSLAPRIIRKLARRSGLRAPYTDAAKLRAAVLSSRDMRDARSRRTISVDFSQAVKP